MDVIVAYYITTRLFWWYHSMANEKVRAVKCPLDNFFTGKGALFVQWGLGGLVGMTAVAAQVCG